MKSFSITDIGKKRHVNQDYVYSSENAVGTLPNLFIVADGMGGHKAGDFASRYCVETLVEKIKNSTLRTPVGIIEEALNEANHFVYEQAGANVDYEGMGTTLVAATIIKENMYVANIGDSRLYILRNSLEQVTQDHSLVEEMVRNGELEKKEARFHPNKNIITRAVGTNQYVVADYFEVPVDHGNIILMCSDGLSNMIEDDEMERIIKRYPDQIEQAALKLVEQANEYGGKDNMAIILIQI